MTRRLAEAACLAVVMLSFAPDLQACGDKSLSAGGIRMQRALAARYPASVLIYTPSASRLPDATRELKLQETLQQVGHTYREVTTFSELTTSAASGQFNIVLADFADVFELQRNLETSPVVVVPVAYKLTKAESAEAAKLCRYVIKAPSRAAQYLSTIAEAVRSRSGIPRRG
jgi:hypothetical protein